MKEERPSCHCGPERSPFSRFLGIGGSLIIALLPKCPFCLLAYSSAMTLCSGTTVYDHTPGWFSWVSILLAGLVIATLIRNYRGGRTLIAMGLAVTGAGLIAYSELFTGYLGHYTTGAYLILAGALLNGGFYVIIRRGLAHLHLFPDRDRQIESSS